MSEKTPDFPAGFTIADPEDTFENGTGPFYRPEPDDGDLRIVVRAEERHMNATGVVHGGLLMTMADLALCYTGRQGYGGERCITISMNSDFLDGGRLGDLIEARAEVLRRTGSLVFARAKVEVGERVLLNCSAVLKRIRRD